MKRYLDATRTPTYAFWAALPLLIAYELLIQIANAGSDHPIRVGADVWIKQLLALMGATGHLFLGAVVAAIGIAIYLGQRKNPVELKAGYFAGMFGESVVYAIVVALAVSNLTRFAFSNVQVAMLPPLATGFQGSVFFNLALSLGAGLYEELVFRVALVGLLAAGFRALIGHKFESYALASVIGAALFSAVHHLGQYGDPFTIPVFFYRFLFGLILQVLLATRGFGIAAWTHALYDIMVVCTQAN